MQHVEHCHDKRLAVNRLAHMALVVQKAGPGLADVVGSRRRPGPELFAECFDYRQEIRQCKGGDWGCENKGTLRTCHFAIYGLAVFEYVFVHVVRV